MGNARDMWKKVKKEYPEINKKNFKLNFGPTLDKWQYLDADHADIVNQIERLSILSIKDPKKRPKIEKAMPALDKKANAIGKKANALLKTLDSIAKQYIAIANKTVKDKDMAADITRVWKELLKTSKERYEYRIEMSMDREMYMTYKQLLTKGTG